MTCPVCGSPMKMGIVEINWKHRAVLPPGLYTQSLFWVEGGEEPSSVMASREQLKAFRCESCHTLVVPTPPPPATPAIFKRIPNPLARTVYRTSERS